MSTPLRCKHCHTVLTETRPGHHKHAETGLYTCLGDSIEYGFQAEPEGTPCRSEQPNPCRGSFDA